MKLSLKALPTRTFFSITSILGLVAACSSTTDPAGSAPAVDDDAGQDQADGSSDDGSTPQSDGATDKDGGRTPTDSGSGYDSGIRDGSVRETAPPFDAGPPCNSTGFGFISTERLVSGPAPAMTGGALVDGFYKLNDSATYGGASGSVGFTEGQGIEIKGNKLDIAYTVLGIQRRLSYTYVSNGNQLTLTQTCPKTDATITEVWPYTASASSFVAYKRAPGASSSWYDSFAP